MFMAIAGFFIGPIGRWILITVVSVGFMAWIRADARSPYEAKVTELETAIIKQHESLERDRKLAEAQAAAVEQKNAELEKIIADSGPTACKLSAAELGRLQRLAKAGVSRP